jgi:hypothetical protein
VLRVATQATISFKFGIVMRSNVLRVATQATISFKFAALCCDCQAQGFKKISRRDGTHKVSRRDPYHKQQANL